MIPSVGLSPPIRALMAVDLSALLAPITAVRLPCETVRIPSTIVGLPSAGSWTVALSTLSVIGQGLKGELVTAHFTAPGSGRVNFMISL